MKKNLLKSLYVICSLFIVVSSSSFLPLSVKAANPVCKIVETDTEYDDFALALADVQTNQTIQLLVGIDYSTSVVVVNKVITFDVNGYRLYINAASGHGLEVGTGGDVRMIDSGSGGRFYVNTAGTGNGLYVHDGGKAEITGAYKSGINDINNRAAYVTGAGSTIIVHGSVSGGFYGLGAYQGASVTIHGNVVGGGAMTVSGVGTTVTIYGNTDGGGTGVFATDHAIVYVKGNVDGGGYGVYASTGAQVTVDGYVKANTGGQVYVHFDSTHTDKMQPDFEPVSSKPDYFEYNDGVSYVWVKRFFPPIIIAIDYIYEGSTAYTDQNATNTVATLVTSANLGETIDSAPSPVPTREGYSFLGWFAEPDTGTEWAFGSSGTALTIENRVNTTSRTMTLYAHWQKVEEPPLNIAINYIYLDSTLYTDQNETNVAATMVTSEEYGATLATAPSPLPTRQGYTFLGWFTEPTGGNEWLFGSSGTPLTSANNVNTADQSLTLYAQWEEVVNPSIKISIIYVYEGSTLYTDQNDTKTVATLVTSADYGSTLATAPNPLPSRSGYIFKGWFTQPTGGNEWIFGLSGTILTYENAVNDSTQTLTLYAHWDAVESPDTGDYAVAPFVFILFGCLAIILIIDKRLGNKSLSGK